MDKEILNDALTLAMEWGENWLKPTQSRLKVAYPHLTRPLLNAYDALSREAMKRGHQLACSLGNGKSLNGDEIAFREFEKEWDRQFAQEYAWTNDENRSRLFSQSVYYAMK